MPEGEVYDTVGGYVMSLLERVPALGDEVPVATGKLTVIRMDGRRVDRLRYDPDPSGESDEQTEAGR
ncbi:hypothetical protein GCM10025863_13260 [Microbacterium suwonense]|uniref:Transporter-associated domain-containing protein n=1 Tax=Microbacterium suwonense TaxID=683047 RepID=A0ABM8FT74_9MICO|nr:hypothetical protein GCM10025863_13260 [Microbacterium suwonense]